MRSSLTGALLAFKIGFIETDIDVLKAFHLLCFGLGGVGASITRGEGHVVGERRHQRARVQPIDAHYVDFNAEDHCRRAQVEKCDQAENEREHGVGVTDMSDDVGDLEDAE